MDEIKQRFAGDSFSDHVAILNAYNGWLDAKRNGSEKDYLWRHFLSSQTLRLVSDMREQFRDLLKDIGFVSYGNSSCDAFAHDNAMLRAVICAGRLREEKRPRCPRATARIHPKLCACAYVL